MRSREIAAHRASATWRWIRSSIIIIIATVLGIAHARGGGEEVKPSNLPRFESILRWRNVGPYRGGRTRAICGVPSQPNVFYMAPVNGGGFKINDLGRKWAAGLRDPPP